MRIDYDPRADAAYIQLTTDRTIAVDQTVACETAYGMVNFDAGRDGRFIGIEVLEAQVQLSDPMRESGAAEVSLVFDRLRDTAYLRFVDLDPDKRPLYTYDDDFENFKIFHDDRGKIIGILLARASRTLPREIMERVAAASIEEHKPIIPL